MQRRNESPSDMTAMLDAMFTDLFKTLTGMAGPFPWQEALFERG
jgi:hypothetical protein